MTRDEIDTLLEAAQAEADAKGDESLRPAVISLNVTSWLKLPSLEFPTTCSSVKHGVRYRGVQVLVSKVRADAVLNRSEAGASGEPFEDLTPRV